MGPDGQLAGVEEQLDRVPDRGHTPWITATRHGDAHIARPGDGGRPCRRRGRLVGPDTTPVLCGRGCDRGVDLSVSRAGV